MTAEQFRSIEESNLREQRALEQRTNRARDQVTIPALSKLRRMEPRDVVEGQIVYHCHDDQPKNWREEKGRWFWHIIDEARYPNDDFKAYVADDGCRYGLHNAYVRA